jgi:hypothetical protein
MASVDDERPAPDRLDDEAAVARRRRGEECRRRPRHPGDDGAQTRPRRAAGETGGRNAAHPQPGEGGRQAPVPSLSGKRTTNRTVSTP